MTNFIYFLSFRRSLVGKGQCGHFSLHFNRLLIYLTANEPGPSLRWSEDEENYLTLSVNVIRARSRPPESSKLHASKKGSRKGIQATHKKSVICESLIQLWAEAEVWEVPGVWASIKILSWDFEKAFKSKKKEQRQYTVGLQGQTQKCPVPLDNTKQRRTRKERSWKERDGRI